LVNIIGRKDIKVTFEYKIGKGSVDIVAGKDGKKTAIEIETGKSDYIYNIKKDLYYGFDEVLVIALDDKIKEKIMPELIKPGSDKDKKIKISDITNFSQIT